MGLSYQNSLKKMIQFIIIIKSMRHFLGSVGVRGSVRGQCFTRHRVCCLYFEDLNQMCLSSLKYIKYVWFF